jgi:ABC-type nitrate/sulfonate/bicarbonate transport system substrate-binding protein
MALPMPLPIRLVLDWTPNSIHTGFYVALANGAYAQAGLDVQISTPEDDEYRTTPAGRLAAGTVDLAIMPSESVISYHANDPDSDFVAVAAVLARDASAIVTLNTSGIDQPCQLDGRVYASYSARFEDAIVQQMIRNDGGTGQFTSLKPARLGIWNTLLTNEADATWVFLPWEGVEADGKGIKLNTFQLGDYGIPYGYSPLLVGRRAWLNDHPAAVSRFLAATAAGYQFATAQPDKAAQLLAATTNHPTLTNPTFVEASQRAVAGYCLTDGQWGAMHRSVWAEFIAWLNQHGLITNRAGQPVPPIDIDRLFTNQFLN